MFSSMRPRTCCGSAYCSVEHDMSEAVSAIPAAIVHYVGKWQSREPEMRVLQVFCAPSQQTRFCAWGALLHELREALFELSDARVTAVKSGWWAEELLGLAQGRHRHPLTEALVGSDAPCSGLGRALLLQTGDDARHADTAEAIAALLPLARSVLAVESALFETALFKARSSDAAARGLAIHWLLQRLPQGLASEDRARIPMHLFARHGLTAEQLAAGQGEPLLRDWTGELLRALPASTSDASLLRRGRLRFDHARLARLSDGKGFGESPALATLWRAWCAARVA